MNNKLPVELEKILIGEIYVRKDIDRVYEAIKRLEVSPSDLFIEFYRKYCGPFWEETLGIELLDICEGKNNIETHTNICREEYYFPKEYLVITELLANEVIVINTATDRLYRVNFEGGDILLRNGELKESWESYLLFIKEYFNC